jgi:hypothetical protein
MSGSEPGGAVPEGRHTLILFGWKQEFFHLGCAASVARRRNVIYRLTVNTEASGSTQKIGLHLRNLLKKVELLLKKKLACDGL